MQTSQKRAGPHLAVRPPGDPVLLEQLAEALRGQHLRTPNGQLLAGVLHGQLEAVDELLQGDGAGLHRDGGELIQHVLDPRNGDDVVLALEADPPAAELALGSGEGQGKEFKKRRPVAVVRARVVATKCTELVSEMMLPRGGKRNNA
jgi:hypothetical protein